MKTAVYTFITQNSLIKSGDTVIVGLSGGPDSVCLLHILHTLRKELNITLVAAHLNHGWRAEAEGDRFFCQNLCETLNIPFESAHASELNVPIGSKGSLEEQGRFLRRSYFKTLKKKYNDATIALGHHQDDQIETFFIRLIRGASIEGLGCMRSSKDGYIRPLLNTSKQDILHYLVNNRLAYCIDTTNESQEFLRNRLRRALPAVANSDTRFVQNTVKAIENMQESYDALKIIINEKFARVTFLLHNVTYFDTKELQQESLFMQKSLTLQWLMHENVPCTLTANFINEIIRFLTNNRGGKHTFHPSCTIVKKNNKAYIRKHIKE